MILRINPSQPVQRRGFIIRRGAKSVFFGIIALMIFIGSICAFNPAKAQPPDTELLLHFGAGEGRGAEGIVLIEGPHPIEDGEPVTLEAWVKWDGGTTVGIFGRYGARVAYHWEIQREGMRIRLHDADATEMQAPPRGEWAHVAVSWADDVVSYYLNGKLIDTAEGDRGAFLEHGNMAIGASHATGDGAVRVFDGLITEFRAWNVARTEEQIRETMNQRLTGEEEGLVGYWPLNEGEWRVAHDLTGNWNDGAVGGMLQWAPEEGWFVRDIEGRFAEEGDTVTFGPVELRDPVGEVTYQWYFLNEPIEGATAPALTLDNVTEEEYGSYYVMVGDNREATPVSSSRVTLSGPDWPMWRFDAARSASTRLEIEDDLHLQWVRELPEPKRAWPHQWDDRGKLDFDVSYSPVVKGSRIFVPSNVTDSLTAYSIEDGEELWRFYTNGPVRLAPVAWRDKVYFVSDDGHLYCVNAENGDLVWKFRGGPSDHRLLGNERIINFWAARGGPVVMDRTVYFAAGIWPLHGVFLYALNAETGEIEWVNDTISSEYVPLPHGGAYGFGGISPQGYIAANYDQLVVSGGRGAAGYFDRRTGEISRLNPRDGHKGGGDYAVHADGMGMKRNRELARRVDQLAGQIGGEVFYKLTARDRIFVSTIEGSIYCFGPNEVEPVRYEHTPEAIAPQTDNWVDIAAGLIDALGETEGYALILGAGSGDLLRELLTLSDLHVVVVENDTAKVRQLRDELAAADMYGRRAAVIEADPAGFTMQPYTFSMLLSEDAGAAGITGDAASMKSILNWIRPYGGIAYFGSENAGALGEAAAAAAVDQVAVEAWEGYVVARRGGPLTGAGEWTHQYHDAANTLLSRDQLVRLPLGVLWFGGPNNHDILPRHSGGPRPKVAGGRQVYLGVETIAARCVYTGRRLWKREFPGIGHPSTNLSLEERWATGGVVYMTNIPGATYIGSPFVALADAIYLRHNEAIHHLNPASGETIAEFQLPGRKIAELYEEDDVPDWGHLKVEGDYLITTAEPHIFEDQRLGWRDSYSGTSSRLIAVMNRHDGEILWQREADIGFRHNAIISSGNTVFLIDGLSENALEHLERRGLTPDEGSVIYALDIATGEEKWSDDSNVFGTFLLYSAEHDILVEGGSQDLRRTLGDEPRQVSARRGEDGEIIWENRSLTTPAAVRGEMLIPGRPGNAISLLTGQTWRREQPHTGETSNWNYRRAYGCNTLNASEHLLLFRTGYAGFFDLEHDTGTGNFSGFRAGCTANMIAADGVLNALDYTRTCTCSYALQTSLALVHMPDDPNIEFWTRYEGSPPNPERFGLNFGAPGRRVDNNGTVWHERNGNIRRHSSMVTVGGGIPWVAASGRELDAEDIITVSDMLPTTYKVRLHFTELNQAVKTGERIFDVVINGKEAMNKFDIVADAGSPLRATVKEFEVNVEGALTVGFRISEGPEFYFDIVADAGSPLRATVKEFEVDVEGALIVEFRRSEGSELNPIISGIELIAQE